MAITLTIGGVDKTSLLRVNSLQISDELNTRNTCQFSLIDTTGAYRPTVGQEAIILDGAVRRFAGTLDESSEAVPLGTSALVVQCQCADYNQIADRHLVARVYENQTLGAIVTDIVTQDLAGEGVTTTNVQTGPTITKATFNYRTVAQAFNDLAELTGYAWYVDYNKDLHFCARETNLAPFSLTDVSANFRYMVVRKTREQYRNRQYIRAGQDITDPRTDSFKGDGKTKAFVLNFPCAKVPTVKVNTVAKTVGIRGLETGKDWYWSKGEKEVTQDDAGTALASTDILDVTYQGLFPIILSSQSDGEISSRAATEGGTGIYEAIEDDQSIDSQPLATQKADGLLRRFGRIPQIVEFETDTGGLAAGQLITINVTKHGLNAQFLIDSAQAQDVQGKFLRYRVRVLDGERIGGWIEFFQKLAQAGRKFVIRENEVLVLLRRFSDVVKLTDTLTVESKALAVAKVTEFPYFSRPSPAYLSDGTQVASGQPRFEPGKFGQAWMGEEGATNYILYSQELDNAAWGGENATVTANAIVAPDGTNTADKVVASGTTGYHYKQQGLGSIASGTTDTLSCYVKKDNTPWFCLGNELGINWYRQWFDLDNGVLGSADAGVTGTIKSIGSGWYRVTATFTHSGASTVRGLLVAPTPANGSINYAQAGESVFVWGAQVEEKPYATSYMATTSAAVTRSAETLTIPTAGVLSATEGTVEFTVIPQVSAVDPGDQHGWNDFQWGSPGSSGFLIRRRKDGTNFVVEAEFYQSGTIIRLQYVYAWTAGERLVCAFRWGPSGCSWWVNGVQRASDTRLFTAPIETTANIGFRDGYRQGDALYDDLRISSRARTDQEIADAYNSNAPLPVDANTTCKLDFDGSLYFKPAAEVGFSEVA